MNKQELIDKLNKQLTTPSEGTDFDYGHDYGIQRAIYLAEDLDEQQAPINKPEKPVVPQTVADWYEEHKDNFEYSVQCLCVQGCKPVRQIDIWFDNDDNKPIETLVKMKLFGYEVEKEQLYTVEIPNPNAGGHVVLCRISDGIVSIAFAKVDRWRGRTDFQLTESEIKKDFEWAWQFAEEVEE